MAGSQSHDAKRGTGVEQFGSNYPFVAPSADVRGLLADLWLIHPRVNTRPPFRIAEIHHIGRAFGVEAAATGDEHTLDLVIVDADDNPVIDTSGATEYYGVAFGPRLYVHQWRVGAAICRCVQHTKFRVDEAIGTYPALIEPDDGWLDERTHEYIPERLLSIEIGEEVLTGDIIFQNGWNIEISADPTLGLRPIDILATGLVSNPGQAVQLDNTIQISAVAGAGEGAFPGCPATLEEGLRTINNIRPTAKGSFLLGGVGCLYVAPPRNTSAPNELTPAALQIGNDCTACRKCEDYVSAYQSLREVYEQLKNSAEEAESVRDQYSDMLDSVNAVADECVVPLALAVTGGKDEDTTVVSVAVQLTNTQEICYTNVVVTLTISFASDPRILHSGGFKTFDDGTIAPWYGADYPTSNITWTRVRPGSSVKANMVLIWEPVPPAHAPVGSITVTATATADGETIPLDKTAYTASTTVSVS